MLGVDVRQTRVLPLTSTLDRAGLAGHVLQEAAVTDVPKDAVAVPLGLELVDRSWLGDRVGQLPVPLIQALHDGIRAVLGL